MNVLDRYYLRVEPERYLGEVSARRLSRVPWNFGGGPVRASGCAHLVIVHGGSDRLGELAIEGGAKRG
jgi:hypothetical protein